MCISGVFPLLFLYHYICHLYHYMRKGNFQKKFIYIYVYMLLLLFHLYVYYYHTTTATEACTVLLCTVMILFYPITTFSLLFTTVVVLVSFYSTRLFCCLSIEYFHIAVYLCTMYGDARKADQTVTSS